MPLLPLISIQFLSLRRPVDVGKPGISTKYPRGSTFYQCVAETCSNGQPRTDDKLRCPFTYLAAYAAHCSLRRTLLYILLDLRCYYPRLPRTGISRAGYSRFAELVLLPSRKGLIVTGDTEKPVFDGFQEERNDGKNGRRRLPRNAKEDSHPPWLSVTSTADLYI